MRFAQSSSSPIPSYASDRGKVRDSGYSQHSASSWGSHVNPPFTQPLSPPIPGPFAPYISTVPLPTGDSSNHAAPCYSPASSVSSVSSLHPVLQYDPSGRSLYFDITLPSQSLQLNPRFDMQEMVTRTPTTIIRLKIRGLPGHWTCDIVNPAGITIGNVLQYIFHLLHVPVSALEHQSLGPAGAIGVHSHRNRTQSRSNRTEFDVGIMRYDYLGSNKFFHGMHGAADGSGWEAVFGPSYQPAIN